MSFEKDYANSLENSIVMMARKVQNLEQKLATSEEERKNSLAMYLEANQAAIAAEALCEELANTGESANSSYASALTRIKDLEAYLDEFKFENSWRDDFKEWKEKQ